MFIINWKMNEFQKDIQTECVHVFKELYLSKGVASMNSDQYDWYDSTSFKCVLMR